MKELTVRDKLLKLQKDAKEPALFPYLQQLFRSKGYSDVQITHGPNEYGKDLVFKEYDERNQIDRWYAVIVKNKNSTIGDFTEGGEIRKQIHQAFDIPYKVVVQENDINQVIIIINGTISEQARVMSECIPRYMRANIQLWNYQRLGEELEKYVKDEFLGLNDVSVNTFIKFQIKTLSEFKNSKELYHGLDITDINEIYISAKTSYHKYKLSKKEYIDYEKSGVPNDKYSKKIEEVDDAVHILHSNKNALIYGIAASGKSLLLKRIGYLAMSTIKEKPDLAIYFEISKIEDVEKFDFWAELSKQFKEVTDKEFTRESFTKIIVLLDGLDEVKDEYKIKLLKYIEGESKLKEKFPIQFIITSREIEIVKQENLLPDFERIELFPFDAGQAFKLVKKLMPESKEKSESFVKAIKDNQLSNTLTRTPMALTLMAILYREDEVDLDELPANITELYNKFSDYYLNRWDSAKGISLQYKYEEGKQILGRIARYMHEENSQEVSRDELVDFLEGLKKRYDYDELADVDAFISNFRNRAGIFGYDEISGNYKFSHLSFQEYFTSTAFDDSHEQDLLDNFCDDWWENTLVFYCGKQPARDVFINSVNTDVVPIDMVQRHQYLYVLAKSLQACHLISRSSKMKIIKNLLFNFDRFYQEYTTNGDSLPIVKLTTLDYILNFRTFFKKLFSTKHINFDDLSDVILKDVLHIHSEYSEVVAYCAAYFLSEKMGDAMYLEHFLQRENLNVRWNRIVYIDIKVLKLKDSADNDLYKKIKRNQLKHKDYIQKQFAQSAFKHLTS